MQLLNHKYVFSDSASLIVHVKLPNGCNIFEMKYVTTYLSHC